jgi:flagellar motor protein MotB
MARPEKFPEPKDDIPAWFMTYSDVITLLMTFFILLLTFATTEPERFEKSTSATFAGGSATGRAGEKMKQLDKDSFAARMRPPASRIAVRGAEMPPITRAPADSTWGEGLRSLDEEEQKQNELTSHQFDVPISSLFDSNNQLTTRGARICAQLSSQLQDLPFRASLQFEEKELAPKVAAMLEHLFYKEMTRPGQLSMTLTRNTKINRNHIRISVDRFSPNAKQNP